MVVICQQQYQKAWLCKICFILTGLVITSLISAQPISEEQINRLLEAAWKQEVKSIDAVMYVHIYEPPKTEDEIRREAEVSTQMAMGSPEKLSGQQLELFNRNVQLHVEHVMLSQKAGRNLKGRIRIDGNYIRAESITISPEMVLLKGTPHEKKISATVISDDTPYSTTFITSGSQVYQIFHDQKKVFIRPHQDSSYKNTILQYSAPLNILQPFLGVYKGLESPRYLPDPNKIENIKQTELLGPNASFSLVPDPNAPDKNIRIEVIRQGKVSLRIVADINDYSMVYEVATYIPNSNNLLLHHKYNNYYDGYPHYVQITEYDLTGNMKEQKTYQFKKVDLNPKIAPEVFDFQCPRGYDISDMRDPAKSKKDAEEKAAQLQMGMQILSNGDANEIKTLLSHPEWEIRMQALLRLKLLLKDKPDEFIRIAEMMKEDERPEIQKKVNEILSEK